MKRIIPSIFCFLTFLLVGCAPSGNEAASAEPAAAPAASGQNATDSGTPQVAEGVKVASDGVVRDAKGTAYCVVMNVPVQGDETTYPKATRDGVTYIFCCQSCPMMFNKDPEKYSVPRS